MPIKIPNQLPAESILLEERIFVMNKERALHQDIRALKILIVNLMPLKEVTETQLLRLLGNTPLQVDVTLIHPATHNSKNTSKIHLTSFYQTFDDIRQEKFDGMIITGAPVENLEFQDVTYWEELVDIMEWSKEHVTTTFHICWGAQAGLYYHYGIKKHPTDSKVFGVFEHKLLQKNKQLTMGFDEVFYAPHSRHTTIKASDIQDHDQLVLYSESDEAGVYLVASHDMKHVFVTGHSEYDRETLMLEYKRDVDKGLPIHIPVNYFPDDNPDLEPTIKWRGHANLLFSNWLNYYVYQITPYSLDDKKNGWD